MVDPVTIISGIALANKAFGEVKQLLQNGRQVADCGKQLSDWARGCSQVQEENNKQSLMGSNASQSAMDRLIHVQTVQKQREELREFMQLYGTPGSWNMFLQFIGVLGWLWVSIIWNDRALIIVNAVAVAIFLNGIINWMIEVYDGT